MGSGHVITELFAFIAEEREGDEGVVATPVGDDDNIPLVAADRTRMEALIPFAQAIANQSGMSIKVIRLSQRTDEQVIEPE